MYISCSLPRWQTWRGQTTREIPMLQGQPLLPPPNLYISIPRKRLRPLLYPCHLHVGTVCARGNLRAARWEMFYKLQLILQGPAKLSARSRIHNFRTGNEIKSPGVVCAWAPRAEEKRTYPHGISSSGNCTRDSLLRLRARRDLFSLFDWPWQSLREWRGRKAKGGMRETFNGIIAHVIDILTVRARVAWGVTTTCLLS